MKRSTKLGVALLALAVFAAVLLLTRGSGRGAQDATVISPFTELDAAAFAPADEDVGIADLAAAADSASSGGSSAEPKKYIKWVVFNVPTGALQKAMQYDIRSHNTQTRLNWVEMLAYLAVKYGGNWKKYRAADLDKLAKTLSGGTTMETLTASLKNYPYYYEAYEAVLGNFLGDYEIQITKDETGTPALESRYGLKAFSPIAKGFGYSHYDDFGDSRSFGFNRRHLGNDLLGSIGTPIVAVEGGVVECMGWNVYGGWRIGIRSFDHKRYYYYAHLRSGRPYAAGLHEGSLVRSGDVIGYLGMTGYSTKENVNGMTKPHLHFGMQLVFDESQKESNNEIWINVYNIVNLLQNNRVTVKRDSATKEYTRVYAFNDLRYADLYPDAGAGKAATAP